MFKQLPGFNLAELSILSQERLTLGTYSPIRIKYRNSTIIFINLTLMKFDIPIS